MKRFLKILITFFLFGNYNLFAVSPLFRWVQYRYEGDIPMRDAVKQVLWELVRITSVEIVEEPFYGNFDDEDFFMSPFIYLTGKNVSINFRTDEKRKILSHITAGGLWLIDNSSENQNSQFWISVRKEFESIFGSGSIKPIPESDAIFRTFFLFQPDVARKFELEGIFVDGRAAVIFSKNLLQNATREKYSMRLLINIIMFSLTTDYKLDQVHQPFIKKRLR
jgi:hypothetical protein